ncbi:MAG: hypothetical protein AAF787_21805, partial [Chloroflexota bacterium]
ADTSNREPKATRSSSGGGGSSPAVVIVGVVLILAAVGLIGFLFLNVTGDRGSTIADAPQGTANPFAAPAENPAGDTTVADSAPAADTGADAAPAPIVLAGPVAAHFQRSDVVASVVDITPDGVPGQQLEITLSNDDRPAILNVYASPTDLQAARPAFFEQMRDDRLMIVQDAAVLFYPAEADAFTARTLRDTMRTIPSG